MNRRPDPWKIDLYSEGSCVYRLDSDGEIESIAAWARSSLVAAEAFKALSEQYPRDRFSQRRRGFVERETPETK
jgi:hypothetical protein